MAFYLRKFGRSIRCLPATKSFVGFSTSSNEGDKIKEEGTYSRTVGKKLQEASLSSLETPSSSVILGSLSPSSLVPRSVRDMAVVLLPRFKDGLCSCVAENLDTTFIKAAKTVPFTCDDILPGYLSADMGCSHLTADSIVSERFSVEIRHADDMNFIQTANCEIINDMKASTCLAKSMKRFNGIAESSQIGWMERYVDNISMSNINSSISNRFTFCEQMANNNRGRKSTKTGKDGPSAEQLHAIKDQLERSVQAMFTSRYNYSILHKDVIFQNHLFGENVIRKGQTAYALELLRMRLKIHSRFSSTAVEVLNITTHEDKGMIRIHWRLKGLPQTELLKFWRLFQSREEISKDDWKWFEAFSYFHVGKDGLVHLHKIDRMLPGNEEPDKLTNKLGKLLQPKPLVS